MKFFTKTPLTFQEVRFVKSLGLKIQLLAFSAALLTGCSTTALSSKTPIISESQTFSAVQYDAQNASRIYTPTLTKEVFRPGDKVTVTVNGFKEFSGIYTVDQTGEIFLGHIGSVRVSGLTIPELQANLYQSYNSCCLVKPNVSIEREGQAFGKIVVDGAVNDAGVFEIDEVIKLSQAIALGGGVNEIANTELVMLSRIIEGERKVSQVNLDEIRLAGANDPLIYPNDVIFIQDSKGRLLYQDFVKTLPLVSAVLLATTR